jgi:hypothetical protein
MTSNLDQIALAAIIILSVACGMDWLARKLFRPEKSLFQDREFSPELNKILRFLLFAAISVPFLAAFHVAPVPIFYILLGIGFGSYLTLR